MPMKEVQADGPSFGPALSGDGRFVVFTSSATNFVPMDTNGAFPDIFIADTGFASGQ